MIKHGDGGKTDETEAAPLTKEETASMDALADGLQEAMNIDPVRAIAWCTQQFRAEG